MPQQLTYLKINRFRHVKPESEIQFKPGFNVVVGQNGAGKTTLLNLVSALLRNNFHQLIDEDFSLQFKVTNDEISLDATIENSCSDNRSELTIEGTLDFFGHIIEFRSDDHESEVRVGDKKLTGPRMPIGKTATDISPDLSLAPLMLLAGDDEFSSEFGNIPVPHHITFGRMAKTAFEGPTRLTEGTETFAQLLDQKPSGNDALGSVTVAVVKSDAGTQILGTHVSQHDLPSDLENIVDTVDAITLPGDISPLDQFLKLTQYNGARLILVKIATKSEQNRQISVFANPLARFRSINGNEISHDHLAFGEKRLLAFLLKLYAYPPTIIVDELANGMHHSWLEQCIELLDELGTQAFLSSQNPLLLDCIPLTRDTYATDHTLVICELTELGEMVWRNLSDTETEDFFRSLDVGLQHVSEIMRAKGLW